MGSFRFSLLDYRFQQIDVIGEGLLACGGKGASGQGPIVLKRFRYGNITGLLQSPNMGREISVRHAQRVAHFREGQLGRSGQHGHNRQPPFLVDNAIELKKWLRIHVSFLRGSVK
jgi:hypothetical protein